MLKKKVDQFQKTFVGVFREVWRRVNFLSHEVISWAMKKGQMVCHSHHIRFTTLAILIQRNLLDFIQILQEELVRAGVLPEDYDFEARKELVPMQPGDVPVTYADTTPLENKTLVLNHTPHSATAFASSPNGIKNITDKVYIIS